MIIFQTSRKIVFQKPLVIFFSGCMASHGLFQWVFPKIGVFPPKMDGENNGKTLLKLMICGENPLFSERGWSGSLTNHSSWEPGSSKQWIFGTQPVAKPPSPSKATEQPEICFFSWNAGDIVFQMIGRHGTYIYILILCIYVYLTFIFIYISVHLFTFISYRENVYEFTIYCVYIDFFRNGRNSQVKDPPNPESKLSGRRNWCNSSYIMGTFVSCLSYFQMAGSSEVVTCTLSTCTTGVIIRLRAPNNACKKKAAPGNRLSQKEIGRLPTIHFRVQKKLFQGEKPFLP